MNTETKTALEAAEQRPEVAPATTPWRIKYDAALAESNEIEAYEKEHRCTNAEASLAVRSRAAAVKTLPRAAEQFAKREAAAAHELELVEAERVALAATVNEWESLKSRRTTIISAIGEAGGLAQTCAEHGRNAPAIIVESAVGEHWPILRTLGDFALQIAAERAAVAFQNFADAKRAELAELETEMRQFAKKNGLPTDALP